MTSKERILTVLRGQKPDRLAVSVYVTWPEYGWRFTGHPIWEVLLGRIDGLDAMDCVLARHPTDFAAGPVGGMGSGWLAGKALEKQDGRSAFFSEATSGRRWRFDLQSHVLVEIDAKGDLLDHAAHPGDARFEKEPPSTPADAEAWFRNGPGMHPCRPGHDPATDPAVARWGSKYFMVSCTVGPFVAVAYAFGFESALTLLAENPRVYSRLMELYLDHFRPHFEWAARAGYDGRHMVESWCSADMISPEAYRNWVAPLHRASVQMIHACGLKADFYSPGWFLPMLGDVRGQGWDMIRIDDQCRGEDLDIGEARTLLGPDQCLLGNLSAYSLLNGNWSEIAARTRYQIESAGGDRPFILSTGSGLCDGTDPAIVDRWLNYAASLA